MSTVTTTTSWGSRVGSSFKGVFGGLILVVAAVGTLFWNEGRTIKRTKALEEAMAREHGNVDNSNVRRRRGNNNDLFLFEGLVGHAY